jgi:hypothetical protein
MKHITLKPPKQAVKPLRFRHRMPSNIRQNIMLDTRSFSGEGPYPPDDLQLQGMNNTFENLVKTQLSS